MPTQYHLPAITDPTGQTAPPGAKPKVTTTLWEDEGTLCFQVEARSICVARREDNDMINGTKLLNVAGMTRGRRDGILKGEKNRHVVKAGAMHLKGVWIPYDRALDFANKEKIIDLLYPLFVTDIKSVLYHPSNYARTAQVLSAAEKRKAEVAAAKEGNALPAPSSTPGVSTPLSATSGQAPGSAPHSNGAASLDRLVSPPPGAPGAGQGHAGAPSSSHYMGYPSSLPAPDYRYPTGPQTSAGPAPGSVSAPTGGPAAGPATANDGTSGAGAPTTAANGSAAPSDSNGGYSLPQISSYQDNQSPLLPDSNNSTGASTSASNDYNPSTTPMTDSLPHTPSSLQHTQLEENKHSGSSPRLYHKESSPLVRAAPGGEEPPLKRLKADSKE